MKVFGFLMVCIVALSACGQTESESETTVVNQRVSQEEFKQLLSELETVQLVDVRTPAEYEEGTIDDAVLINFNDPNFSKNIQTLNKQAPVMIFCRSGGRSGRALAMMKDLGFEEVYELEGGFSQWNP